MQLKGKLLKSNVMEVYERKFNEKRLSIPKRRTFENGNPLKSEMKLILSIWGLYKTENRFEIKRFLNI